VSKVVATKKWAHVKTTCKIGTPVRYWSEHIDDVELKPADSVLVFLGSNDWGNKPDIKPLLVKLKGTNCVIVGPPLIRGKVGAADILKHDVEDDDTCRYFDSRTLNLEQVDGVHTNEPVRWLRAALRLLSRP